jgi:ectoine hydrolase
MAPDRLPFPPAEYDARIARTRKAMASRNLDLVLTSDPSNMAWLTGYDGWSFYVHQGVLLGPRGRADLVGPAHGRFRRQTHRLHGRRQYLRLCRRLRPVDRAPSDGAHGPPHRRARPRQGAHRRRDGQLLVHRKSLRGAQARAPNATFSDATGLVNWQRTVKSDNEIEFMQRAGRIVERMYEAVFEMIEPGLPKNRMVAEIYRVAIEGADGHWGDYPAIVPMMGSGLDATAPHLTWDDQPFRNDEITFFELTGCYRRYHCPLPAPSTSARCPTSTRRPNRRCWRRASARSKRPCPATPATTSRSPSSTR